MSDLIITTENGLKSRNFTDEAWQRTVQHFQNDLETWLRVKGYTPKTTFKTVPVGNGEMKSFPVTTYVNDKGEEIVLNSAEDQAIRYSQEHPKDDPADISANYWLLGGLGLTRPLGNMLWNGIRTYAPWLSQKAMPFVAKHFIAPTTAGMAWDEAQRAVTGTTTTEEVSNYLQGKGWNPMAAEFVGGFTNPGYWINFGGTGQYTRPLFNKVGLGLSRPSAYSALTSELNAKLFPRKTFGEGVTNAVNTIRSGVQTLNNRVIKPYRLSRAMNSTLSQPEPAYARPYMSLDQFKFSPIDEIVTRVDNGNFRGAFTESGAYVQDGFLYPGQARLPGQRNFTWWNENELFATLENPFSRIFLGRKSDIPGLQRVREMKEAVGQWRPGSRKAFVLKSEMVTPEPTPTSRIVQYNLDPYESSLGNNLYVRSDIPTTQIYRQEVFPYRNPTQFQQGVHTSGRHQVIGQGPVRGSRNVDVPSSPGPIRYHPSRITLDAQTSTGETLHLQNYQDMKLFPRGEYRPDGIRFDRVTNYTEGFRPNVQGKWINPENGIPITDWTSQYNWPMEYPSRRWLPTSDNSWMWTDLQKIPVTLFHKNGGKLKHAKD